MAKKPKNKKGSFGSSLEEVDANISAMEKERIDLADKVNNFKASNKEVSLPPSPMALQRFEILLFVFFRVFLLASISRTIASLSSFVGRVAFTALSKAGLLKKNSIK